MGCVIKYKGQSIPEEQFLQYLNKQIAINNLFNENAELASQVYETAGVINTSEIPGLGIMAADYLLTGGIDSIISSDYFAHALMGVFTKDANNILNIWNKYKDNVNNKYGNLADFIKTNEYNDFIQEVKQSLINKYSNDVIEIIDTILNHPTGLPVRLGNQLSIKIDNLNNSISEITPQQKQQAQILYSQYLDQIFPSSKVKDIVYHGTDYRSYKSIMQGGFNLSFFGKNDQGDRGYAIYLAFRKDSAIGWYGNNLIYALVNTINPYIVKENGGYSPEFHFNRVGENIYIKQLEELEQDRIKFINKVNNNDIEYLFFNDFKGNTNNKEELIDYVNSELNERKSNLEQASIDLQNLKNNDSVITPNYEIAIKPEQIHILGSKQDIEGFKEFVTKDNIISDISFLGKLQGDLMESEKGQISVNKQQLLMLLGPTMYNKPLAQVAVKELLQNSFDAVKARMNITDNKETGNIDIIVNYDNRTISIKDDGIGMTPDIVKNAFLSIGGTNKEGLDVSERSGGFGLAKVQFLLGSEYVKVVTVRDGIKTSLEATAVQLYDDDFSINKEQTNEPNGSYVEVKIPESYTTPEGTKREIEFPGRYRNDDTKYQAFDILDKPLIGNVNVSFTHVKNKQEYKKVVPIGENTTEQTLPPLFSKIDFAWGSADLYMSTEKKENPKHRILSSGIYQFNYSFRFKDWEDIPYDIVVNIKPSVSSTSEQYPFNNQRENFKNTVTEDIKSLNNYLKKYAFGEAEKEAKDVFSNITGLPKVDPNKVLTPEEREKLYADVEKTIAENKQKRIEQGLESAEEEVRKIWKLVIDKEGVKNVETGNIEVSNEKSYGSSFKADREIEKAEVIETTNFNPTLPQYHNNTNFNYLEISGATEFFSDFGSVVLEMVRFVGNELGYDYRKLKSEDEKFFAGVSIDKQYGGVHVRKVINAIFVNPLAFNVSSLEEAVGVALHVTIHEINHTTESREGANFTTALGTLYGKIYGTGKYSLYEGLFRSVYKKHFETFKILKNEYDKSTTRNLSQSFSGDQIQRNSFGNVQGNANEVSRGQSTQEGYRGDQESNKEDKIGDVIISNLNEYQSGIGGLQLVNSSKLYEEISAKNNKNNSESQKFTAITQEQLDIIWNLDKKSNSEVLEFVLSNVVDDDLRTLASLMLKEVDKLNHVTFNVGRITRKGNLGFHNATSGNIYIDPHKAINKTALESSGYQTMLRVILHEYAHAFTTKALLYPERLSEWTFRHEIGELYNLFKHRLPSLNHLYGFINEAEFIAEVLTNNNFRLALISEEIKIVPSPGIWNKIVFYIGKLLGLIKEVETVYNDKRVPEVEKIIEKILIFINVGPGSRVVTIKELEERYPDSDWNEPKEPIRNRKNDQIISYEYNDKVGLDKDTFIGNKSKNPLIETVPHIKDPETVKTTREILLQYSPISEYNGNLYIPRNMSAEDHERILEFIGSEINSNTIQSVKELNSFYRSRYGVSRDIYLFSESSGDKYKVTTDPEAINELNNIRDKNIHIIKHPISYYNNTEVSYRTDENVTDKAYQDKKALLEDAFGVQVVEDTTIESSRVVVGKDGSVHILVNPNLLKSDTLLHEISHIVIDMLPGGINNTRALSALQQLKDSPEGRKLIEEITNNYPDLDSETLNKEILATAMGIEATNLFTSSIKSSWWQDFVSWIWRQFGIKIPGANIDAVKELSKFSLADHSTLGVLNRRRIKEAMYEQRFSRPTGSKLTAANVNKELVDTILLRINNVVEKYKDTKFTTSLEILKEAQEELIDAARLNDINAIIKFVGISNKRMQDYMIRISSLRSNDSLSDREIKELLSELNSSIEAFNVGTSLDRSLETTFKEGLITQVQYIELKNSIAALNMNYKVAKERFNDLSIIIMATVLADNSSIFLPEYKKKYTKEFELASPRPKTKEELSIWNTKLNQYINKRFITDKEEIRNDRIKFYEDVLTYSDHDLGAVSAYIMDAKAQTPLIQVLSRMLDHQDMKTRIDISKERTIIEKYYRNYRNSFGKDVPKTFEEFYNGFFERDSDGNYYMTSEFKIEFLETYRKLWKDYNEAVEKFGISSKEALTAKRVAKDWMNENTEREFTKEWYDMIDKVSSVITDDEYQNLVSEKIQIIKSYDSIDKVSARDNDKLIDIDKRLKVLREKLVSKISKRAFSDFLNTYADIIPTAEYYKMYARMKKEVDEGRMSEIDFTVWYMKNHEESIGMLTGNTSRPISIWTKIVPKNDAFRNPNYVNNKIMPTSNWKNPTYQKVTSDSNKARKEFFLYLTELIKRADVNTDHEKSLLGSQYQGVSWMRLPSITKEFYERLANKDYKGIFTDFKRDTTKVRVDATDAGIIEEDNVVSGEKNVASKLKEKTVRRVRNTILSEVEIEDDRNYIRIATDLKNEEDKKVPVFYRGKIDPQDQSLDLASVVFLNYAMSVNHKYKKEILPDFELINGIFVQKKFGKTSGIEKLYKYIGISRDNARIPYTDSGLNSMEYKKIQDITNNRIYGIGSYEQGSLLGMDVRALSNSLAAWNATVTLGLNWMSAIPNAALESINNYIEAISGEVFTLSNLRRARVKFYKDYEGIINDVGRVVPSSKTNLLADYFNAIGDFSALVHKFEKDTRFKAMINASNLSFMNKLGEVTTQSILMYAILDSIKVMNANGEFIDKNGNVVDDYNRAMTIDEASYVEDGVLKWNTNLIYTNFTPGVEFNKGGNVRIEGLIKKKVFDLHGNYDSRFRSIAQGYALGQHAFLFRRWLPRAMRRRFLGLHTTLKQSEDLRPGIDRFFSEDLQDYEEGMYVSSFRFLYFNFKDMINLRREIVSSNWNELSPHEKANIYRTVSELGIAILLGILGSLAKGLADDEDEAFLYFSAYIFTRLNAELMQYINIRDFMRIVKTPATTLNLLEKYISWFIQVFGVQISYTDGLDFNFNDYYETGRLAGRSKTLYKTERILPIWHQINRDSKEAYSFFHNKAQ